MLIMSVAAWIDHWPYSKGKSSFLERIRSSYTHGGTDCRAIVSELQ